MRLNYFDEKGILNAARRPDAALPPPEEFDLCKELGPLLAHTVMGFEATTKKRIDSNIGIFSWNLEISKANFHKLPSTVCKLCGRYHIAAAISRTGNGVPALYQKALLPDRPVTSNA